FRPEAIEHRRRAEREGGSLLRVLPQWVDYAYKLLVAVSVAALLFLGLAPVNEYAEGPAAVRARSRIELSAKAAGTVSAIAVLPGQHVTAGDVLVRFDNVAESAELTRIRREFELQLRKTLRDPGDQVARQALAGLRAQRELAESALVDRSIRAPHAGR